MVDVGSLKTKTLVADNLQSTWADMSKSKNIKTKDTQRIKISLPNPLESFRNLWKQYFNYKRESVLALVT